jgi:hypothetical protein
MLLQRVPFHDARQQQLFARSLQWQCGKQLASNTCYVDISAMAVLTTLPTTCTRCTALTLSHPPCTRHASGTWSRTHPVCWCQEQAWGACAWT